jgi:hypothetical protein
MKPNLTVGGIIVRHILATYTVIFGVLFQITPMVVLGIAIFYTAIIGLDPLTYLLEELREYREKRHLIREKETKARQSYADLLRELKKEGIIRLRWEREGQVGPSHAH